MKEIIFELSLEGTRITETIEVEEDLTDDEIEDLFVDWRSEYLHGGWSDGSDWTEVT